MTVNLLCETVLDVWFYKNGSKTSILLSASL